MITELFSTKTSATDGSFQLFFVFLPQPQTLTGGKECSDKLKFQMRVQDDCQVKKIIFSIGMFELMWHKDDLKCWKSEQQLKLLQNAYFQVIMLNYLSCVLCWRLAARRGLGQGSPESFFLSHSPSRSSGEELWIARAAFNLPALWNVQPCPWINTIPAQKLFFASWASRSSQEQIHNKGEEMELRFPWGKLKSILNWFETKPIKRMKYSPNRVKLTKMKCFISGLSPPNPSK